ncbi:tRNA glutamyl-Q(34) synthetase GluQRS [Raoultella ornithinolytica]|jgi:glutamyl-Q tRNA(Asp) synthetase|uniref:tRNA glutamyl-Q(34) synthetase GluQRS n=1 Tax=Raoultella ornithinolytica TaxID=54291 RepID=UPI0019520185|nr:tRNA glutamyl-Q(34) synthetase GluQRS [Raoultella ornithinolytica]MBM6476605.1 tRNA glutamyl-Q(34) synthetase GluQRS [Raoultella ornithinolytica]MCF6653879.1 tRNA glutamyl-Q(34) synthetase GluQRS [Raoultella ornithinolytica]MCF6706316.1 tRNA glutamyl-Q(34) synthetase GluQRS [Raoultella ornithinolytica]QSA10922.1 tRNA glutamyl-Q(34) synthetase GluQRS [Raoultella ornithinolytica]HAT1598027.1 tRNA glutamyl-Q(34) synthetase GluQRS [Raoultella ornithinolytica]
MNDSHYIGRFAPSPSGELHFGSLIAALGSYLQARAQNGIWRVRIEDIDPPREVPGAASTILRQLEHYGLHWDGEVLWQSQRHEAYREQLAWLHEQGLCYYCTCTRARIHAVGGVYDGHCRDLRLSANDAALRLRQTRPVLAFYDRLRGTLVADEALAREDFIIHRRDGLFAYNLAVVVDDHFQGVSEIVRGADLIEPTVRQISLYQHFGWQAPDYVHLPLAVNAQGNKLSKQNHAPALPEGDPRPEIMRALMFLNQDIEQEWRALSIEDLLKNAVANWDPQKIQHSQMTLAEL